jgi:uncharacterized protein (DUF362 family)/Pyruvate/2-oxoacid:ferredoxin oxidoreductase delta subunit
MKKAKVAVVRCPDYKLENLSQSLEKCLRLLGGLSAFLTPRSKVFVKVNHLSPSSPPDKAINTHPLFVQEVLRLLRNYNVDVTVGDDIYSCEEDGFLISGYRQVCADLGIRLVNLKETGFREVPIRGIVLKKAYIARPVLEADFVLNLPKLKTHSYTIFTGAVKNMFGFIPYGLRLNFHRQFVRNEVFSQMLVDLFSFVPPHLTAMDAIIGMEGEGPSSGAPKNIGLILASSDAVALDAVATRIVGYDPLRVFTTYCAHERGLGVGDVNLIDIAGEKIEDIEVRDFRHSAVAVSLFQKKLPSFLYAYLQSQLALIPEIRKETCTACLECAHICPQSAISLLRKAAWIDERRCIHCLCCHEVCRFQSIRLKQLPLGKLMRRGSTIYRKAAVAIGKIF